MSQYLLSPGRSNLLQAVHYKKVNIDSLLMDGKIKSCHNHIIFYLTVLTTLIVNQRLSRLLDSNLIRKEFAFDHQTLKNDLCLFVV